MIKDLETKAVEGRKLREIKQKYYIVKKDYKLVKNQLAQEQNDAARVNNLKEEIDYISERLLEDSDSFRKKSLKYDFNSNRNQIKHIKQQIENQTYHNDSLDLEILEQRSIIQKLSSSLTQERRFNSSNEDSVMLLINDMPASTQAKQGNRFFITQESESTPIYQKFNEGVKQMQRT